MNTVSHPQNLWPRRVASNTTLAEFITTWLFITRWRAFRYPWMQYIEELSCFSVHWWWPVMFLWLLPIGDDLNSQHSCAARFRDQSQLMILLSIISQSCWCCLLFQHAQKIVQTIARVASILKSASLVPYNVITHCVQWIKLQLLCCLCFLQRLQHIQTHTSNIIPLCSCHDLEPDLHQN